MRMGEIKKDNIQLHYFLPDNLTPEGASTTQHSLGARIGELFVEYDQKSIPQC